ncbi:MAG: hypothetical protein LBJ18_02570 [Rickettsiales bacterium]|nr:hypothetical protein [Rickettsiales bacterium]
MKKLLYFLSLILFCTQNAVAAANTKCNQVTDAIIDSNRPEESDACNYGLMKNLSGGYDATPYIDFTDDCWATDAYNCQLISFDGHCYCASIVSLGDMGCYIDDPTSFFSTFSIANSYAGAYLNSVPLKSGSTTYTEVYSTPIWYTFNSDCTSAQKVSSIQRCARGYYDTGAAGTCTVCPGTGTTGPGIETWMLTENASPNATIYAPAVPITACFERKGKTGSDTTGSYAFTQDCFYSL